MPKSVDQFSSPINERQKNRYAVADKLVRDSPSGRTHRTAITGRFVKPSTATRYPKTTVVETTKASKKK
jgi:hypothetical protein